MWRISLRELDRRDADRPDVRAPVVATASDNLGGHPMRRPDDRVLHARPVRRRRHPKVGKFDLAVGRQQDVAGLMPQMQQR